MKKIALGPLDSAIIIRKNGVREVVIPNKDDDDTLDHSAKCILVMVTHLDAVLKAGVLEAAVQHAITVAKD